MDQVLPPESDNKVPLGFSATRAQEILQRRVTRATHLVEAKPVVSPLLLLALQVIIGGFAVIATILALFAWSDAGL
jgi:hypothetical protein